MKNRWWLRKSWMWVWGILTALGGIGAVGIALWQVPWWLDAHHLPKITQPQATAVTGVRTALLAMGAGGLAVVGILYTHRTLHQTREGQVTDRYTKAIGQIASDKPVEQLGGIYALERIMRDSVKDHATIVEVLAAFVREHAPAPVESSTQKLVQLARQRMRTAKTRVTLRLRGYAVEYDRSPRPTEPVQAALTVLGRRPRDRGELFRLNLGNANLRKADLRWAHLEGADLRWAHLEGADLFGAHLESADLRGAHLEEAHLNAYLELARLHRAHLERAILERAELRGARLEGAHLEGATHLTVDQLVSARPRESTSLPPHLAADDRVTARIAAVETGEKP
ncbi:pentapeptide repeat-containing protein [Streptomyces sp. NPDC127097]|uniref:pentapeptide repeat-containing protein n=1 Tax=Streptomyces sp. NPDC127097 TaxID=3347136 RepID=UPI003661B582